MSGVRGSPLGGSPGALKKVWRMGPEKISPIPATLLEAGEVVRSRLTALAVEQLLLSQIIETSSSVGPMPVGLEGDSDSGMHPAPSRIVAGEVLIGSLGEFEIPR